MGLGGRDGCGAAQSGCGLGTEGGSPAEVTGKVLLSVGISDFFRVGSDGKALFS